MTQNPSIDLVVFDLMATTFIDKGRVARVFKEVAKSHGISAEEVAECMTKTMGMSKPEVLHILGVPQAAEDFQDALIASFESDPAKLIEGVEGVLDWLADRDIKHAFNTGFSRFPTNQMFETVGWQDYLDVAITDSDVRRGRPFPYMIYKAMEKTGTKDVRRVCVVGDNPVDLQAGMMARAGLVVGVTTSERCRSDFPGIMMPTFSRKKIIGTPSKNMGEYSDCWLISHVIQIPALLEYFEESVLV